MEHSGEIWQEYDYHGLRVMNGGIKPGQKSQYLYSGVAVMLYRYKNGQVEFLFQHRAKEIIGSPDKWDVSAGGHINYNEPRLQTAIRETKEEIGVEITEESLYLSSSYVRYNNYVTLYFAECDRDESEFSFNDHEVQAVRWVPYLKLPEFWPLLKKILGEDGYFKIELEMWNQKILAQHGNH